jgi:triacylglycerol lipase
VLPIASTNLRFNWPNARALAEASFRAYVGPDGFPSDQSVWIQDAGTDAHALIEDRGNCVVIAFRGSEVTEDYLQDAKFEFTELVWSRGEAPVKVHRGFLEDFEALNVQLVVALKTIFAKRGPQPLFLTGHSLGAAIATLCALEFARQKFAIYGVYTFGGPRVGNAAFAEIYADNPALLGKYTFRVVNENDLVPRMPPWINGYRHVGQNIFLPDTRVPSWILNPSRLTIALSDALGLWGAVRDLHDVLIEDHFIAAYQQRIQLL